ncbi:MAG TPA: beta-eliminating lyase-related protein [Ktedonobacteraceae bacterium]|nr:beta-eliminating lyase-related protein [Ktedonobacteraceae bacterium]
MTHTDEAQQVYKACTRFLTQHYPRTPQQVLRELAETTDPDIEVDRYGQGEIINRFEAEVAALLGKEAAVFMPSGTMCQQIALRIWCERRGTSTVVFHPTSHLEIHEQKAYERLHGLHAILAGSPDRLLTLKDLSAIAEPVGALLLELPQREIGGQLPTWEELNEVIDWALQRHIPTHLDGARLWETQPFYRREYAEIAGLFDTVYVSFYKILGGIAGSMLAGPADVIAEARVWQRRHGGNLIHLYPYVLSAQKGLREKLGRMEVYCAKAKEIAALLAGFPQIEIVPNPPHTNMMHVFLRGEQEKLLAAALEIAKETRVRLFQWLTPAVLPAYQKFELTVGDATLDLPNEEIESLFRMLFEKANR